MGENRLTVIGLLVAVGVGGLVYCYSHFLVPSKPSDLLDKPSQVFESPKSSGIIVQVSGAVRREGVYRLNLGDRILDAIKLAGGESGNADLSPINLAEEIKDGQKIVVPTKVYQDTRGSVGGRSGGQDIGGNQGQKINLNTASEKELDELPGVGPATARKIIEARPFSKPEDLLKIPRFGKNKVEKLKDKVTF